ncbi:MAG: ribonuclease HI family protein, partial [Spirochaetia bacterium]|nr:ribonuclease HI family protein [Spirochaetia bacterium]
MSQILWKLFCDGASRGNPGPASLGFVVYNEEGTPEIEHGEVLGTMTNNEAEYNALLNGVKLTCERFSKHHSGKMLFLSIFMDSELVVKQINGQYRVKNERLKPLHQKIKGLLQPISYSIQHIP